MKYNFDRQERLYKKLSCNERELNANGTVDNVLSYQFLCTLYIKINYLKKAAIFLIILACTLQYF